MVGEDGDTGAGLDAQRKFRATRHNEQVKLFCSLLNTLAAAVIATAFIVPSIRSEASPNELDRPGWVLIGLALHVIASLIVRFVMRPED